MYAGLCFLSVLAAASAYYNPAPIPITVYYETLCPDSIHFINKKLIPAFTQRNFNFNGLLANLTLVPYGHVTVINAERYQFNCQHGQSECEGNKLHGCAIKYINDKIKLLEYISCLLNVSSYVRSSSYMPYPVNECRHIIPIETLSRISNCYNSNEGWDIFHLNGRETDKLLGSTKFFIPYISFYNIKDDKISANAFNDFRKTLCSRYDLEDYACSDYNY